MRDNNVKKRYHSSCELLILWINKADERKSFNHGCIEELSLTSERRQLSTTVDVMNVKFDIKANVCCAPIENAIKLVSFLDFSVNNEDLVYPAR
jgi:hypothetical protein